MDIEEYLYQKRLTLKEFALQIGYTPERVGHVKNGKFTPGKKMANIIFWHTEGAVDLRDKVSYYGKYKNRKKADGKKDTDSLEKVVSAELS